MARRRPKKSKTRLRPKVAAPPVAPIVRASALLFDREDRQLIVFTDDMLLNQLRREGPKIEASFDRLCETELAQLSAFLSKSSSLLFSGLRSASRKDDELRVCCAQLLLNACNSFAVAVAVLRMGYVLQPGIVVRSLLEAVSTALHLIQKPTDLGAYQRHELQSPKTMAAAKQALPMFGQLYGYFSDNFAHIGHLHRSVTPIREYTERHAALDVNMSFLRIAAWLVYVTSELAFNEVLDEPRYWHPVDNGYKYDPSPSERDWMNAYFNLTNAA
jgi:hypothetical protein